MSEFIQGSPEEVDTLRKQLKSLWYYEANIRVFDAFARTAIYESFSWQPHEHGFGRRPLQLRPNDRGNQRSNIQIMALAWPPHKANSNTPYPIGKRYDKYFPFDRTVDEEPQNIWLSFKNNSGVAERFRIPNASCVRRQRRLVGEPIHTLPVATHLAFERFVLATGDYPETPQERAAIVAEFSAFAESLESTGKYLEEFPYADQLVPFAAAARRAYEVGPAARDM